MDSSKSVVRQIDESGDVLGEERNQLLPSGDGHACLQTHSEEASDSTQMNPSRKACMALL